MQVIFEPDRPVSYTGELQVRTDAPGGNATIPLRGMGGLSGEDLDEDGYSPATGDCDDDDPDVNPGAAEVCDGVDTDCDGFTPADEADEDRDGFPLCADDCDDEDERTYPGAPEICDDKDNDCDGYVPDAEDQDNDGISICGDADRKGPGDCDDLNKAVFPGNPEVCDGFDNDCDEQVDNVDADGDGRSVCFATGDCDDGDPAAYPVIVSPRGDDEEGEGTDASPYETLAFALTQLDEECRTVVLVDGEYEGIRQTITSRVTVAGRSGDVEEVVLVAEKKGRLFDVLAAGELTLRDVTLTGGDSEDPGGAIRVTDGDLRLEHVVLDGNASGADGGAVAVTSGSLTVLGESVFRNNRADADGGAVLLDQSTLVDEPRLLEGGYELGTLYVDNAAEAAFGGALRIEGGNATLRQATLRGNVASEGGAISAVGAGTYLLENNAFLLNEAAEEGGALALRDAVSATGFIRNNRLQDNTADTGGGGIAVLGAVATLSLHNNTLTFNASVGAEGAGILIKAADASGLDVANHIVHRNKGGSGIFAAAGTGPTVRYNTVYLTPSGVDFGGDAGDGSGGPADATNDVRPPRLESVSDDDNPDNDDLTLASDSDEYDSGVDDAAFDDADDQDRNDRGYTGGPATLRDGSNR